MDSPVEFGPVSIRQFAVGPRTFRFAVHHTGQRRRARRLRERRREDRPRRKARSSASIPSYEPGHYTFLADYLPYATGDGMEHRNSTVMTAPRSIATGRRGLLDTVAHEFFHGWNVERIRPRSLEPFDFERANMSGELWLAEGFTQYYGPLVAAARRPRDLQRPGRTLTGLVETVGAARARWSDRPKR